MTSEKDPSDLLGPERLAWLNEVLTKRKLPDRIEFQRSEPEDTRPSWDEWGLGLARQIATRADCTRRQVGAVIMTPDRSVVATGYNGAPAGVSGCLSAGACPRGRMSSEQVAPGSSYDTGAGACHALHAEQNALLRASWDQMKGSTLYITDEPCDGCARMIAGTPIGRIVTPTSVMLES